MPATAFLIGIDLGTTNSACAFVDLRQASAAIKVFQIEQLVDPSVVAARPVLPSFLYFPEPHEIESGAVALPWDVDPSASRRPESARASARHAETVPERPRRAPSDAHDSIAGVLARERGALVPGRQVSSAKSWLAHPDVDRRAAILPWIGTDTGPRISPVDASARYLAHIRDAWNATIAAGDDRLRLERQTIVLTVPASFDEEARELTVEAARLALLDQLTLLEEPMAAFYAWMAERDTIEAQTALGDEQMALVCDVGGGTTDFSLIRVRADAHGTPAFERVAIGDHLLLGGDNVDAALATLAERRMLEARPSLRLAITQKSALRRLCSAAKELMLGPDPPDHVAVTILGAGRTVVGESISTELTPEDVERTMADFLPPAAPHAPAMPRDRRAGLRELGLPYEADPAITRHLAAFLSRSAAAVPDAHRAIAAVNDTPVVRPDLVLFNGGFFTPELARSRVVEALTTWFGAAPRVLTTSNLEAAVAVGAAAYARLRAGIVADRSGHRFSGTLIKAGSGRAYYIGLRSVHDQKATAVCVLARGTDEGTITHIEHSFTVTTNRPISFSLFSSTIRTDQPGVIVSLDLQDVHRHAPLVTVLRFGRKSRQVELPVRVSVAFTEVGTLEIWCESQTSDHRWRLQFQLREQPAAAIAGDLESNEAPTESDAPDTPGAVVGEDAIVCGEQAIRSVFSSDSGEITSLTLVAHLEQMLGYGKAAWPISVIRRFADVLIDVAEGRRRSPDLESRWLNLFGFCLRPGFGAAKDPWRVTEARKIYAAGMTFSGAIQNRVEWLVLWQRAAGGFSAGQQRELAQRVMSDLGLGGKKGSRFNPQIERESWRLLASLERIDARLRTMVGNELIRRVRREPDNTSFLWAIGRLGARVPLYGPLSSVVPPEDARLWVDALLAVKRPTPDLVAAIVQVATLTGDPLRDLDQSVIRHATDRMREIDIEQELVRPLIEIVPSSRVDVNRVFGEPLPNGLRLDVPST